MRGECRFERSEKNNRHFSVDDVLAEAQSKRKANRQKTAADSIDPPKNAGAYDARNNRCPWPALTPGDPTAPQPEMPVQAPPPGQPGQVGFQARQNMKKKGPARGKRAKERFEETEDIYYGCI